MAHDRLPCRTCLGAHGRFAGASLGSIHFVESPLTRALGDTLTVLEGTLFRALTGVDRSLFGALTSLDRSLPRALGGLLTSDPRRHALGVRRRCREGKRKNGQNGKHAYVHGFTPIEAVERRNDGTTERFNAEPQRWRRGRREKRTTSPDQ